VSWSNDACPSWIVVSNPTTLRVWVDYEKKSRREMNLDRFTVQQISDPEDMEFVKDLYDGDDWEEVLETIKRVVDTPPESW